ncbi:hypothetical protein SB6419_02222 [Klebsiella spallanzanii]|nr:hypothetical protein SB6419_02222 [Klebsiella spallanzanii]
MKLNSGARTRNRSATYLTVFHHKSVFDKLSRPCGRPVFLILNQISRFEYSKTHPVRYSGSIPSEFDVLTFTLRMLYTLYP